ncbi:multicomponent Na+:H+ antiporter subunit C [Streptomyces sp. Ag109_G2-6]|uniref:NADH-quinone oxidoreductase subunit K n=1 Tax=Streptomyces TaxID=1883 RepID=UPI0009A4F441|nr:MULTISPECIES: NADH-quinone oxidoreductase subunit K [Streptomyces]RPF44426.1 multicomponent Na+:H+ antiporter subunit C [Streptomyces sp. Ag109_G2-6]
MTTTLLAAAPATGQATTDPLPYLAAGWILLAGLHGLVTSRHAVHAIGCLTVVQSGTYVLLLAVGYRRGATAPYFTDIPPTTPVADPVAHALTLTDVVVGAAVSALLLALVLQTAKRHGTADPDALTGLKG